MPSSLYTHQHSSRRTTCGGCNRGGIDRDLTLISVERPVKLTIGLEVHDDVSPVVGVRQVHESLDQRPSLGQHGDRHFSIATSLARGAGCTLEHGVLQHATNHFDGRGNLRGIGSEHAAMSGGELRQYFWNGSIERDIGQQRVHECAESLPAWPR